MSDYLYDKVFQPLSKGKIDEAYQGYQELMKLNRTPWWNFVTIQPHKKEALKFLRTFRELVDDEVKEDDTLQGERVIALDKIVKFINNQTGPSCRALPQINPYRYAIDLALRVRRPRIIDQSETNFCGPASIICAYFKTDPKKATKFALDLVENGSGDLKAYNIKAPDHIKNKAPPDRFETTPVDWVLLTSLRYHFEPLAAFLGFFSKDVGDMFRQLTKPGLLTAMLTKMGYKAVADRTFGYEALPKSVKVVTKVLDAATPYSMDGGGLQGLSEWAHLASAQRNLEKGRLIFLLAYLKMSRKAVAVDRTGAFPKRDDKNVAPTYGLRTPDLHWTLVRRLEVTIDRVKIRFYSEGEVLEADYTMDQFLGVYRGYVWADPS